MASERSTITAVVLNDTSRHGHHGCALVMQTISSLATAHGIEIIATCPLRIDWRNQPDVVAAMERAQLIIVNGEGTIHHDAPAGRTLLRAGVFARERGKVAALINMTWEANSASLTEFARSFDLVSVRESASAAELGLARIQCRLTPDLALWSIAPRPEQQPRKGVAFTDNVVTGRTLAQYAAMRRLGARPLSLLHGQGQRYLAGSFRRYLRAGASLAAAWNAAAADHASQHPDIGRFLKQVRSRALIVTGRFHMVIMCLATSTPFLAVSSNTHKIDAVLSDVGLAHRKVAEPEHLGIEEVEKASRWEDAEIARLNEYVEDGRRRIDELFQDMRRLVDDQSPSASRIGLGGA